MAWCSLRSIHVPTIDVGCLRTHSPLAAAGSSVWRYSSRNGSPFACLSLSTSPGIKEAVATDKAPAALGPYCQAIKANNILCLWCPRSYSGDWKVHLRQCRGSNRAGLLT